MKLIYFVVLVTLLGWSSSEPYTRLHHPLLQVYENQYPTFESVIQRSLFPFLFTSTSRENNHPILPFSPPQYNIFPTVLHFSQVNIIQPPCYSQYKPSFDDNQELSKPPPNSFYHYNPYRQFTVGDAARSDNRASDSNVLLAPLIRLLSQTIGDNSGAYMRKTEQQYNFEGDALYMKSPYLYPLWAQSSSGVEENQSPQAEDETLQKQSSEENDSPSDELEQQKFQPQREEHPGRIYFRIWSGLEPFESQSEEDTETEPESDTSHDGGLELLDPIDEQYRQPHDDIFEENKSDEDYTQEPPSQSQSEEHSQPQPEIVASEEDKPEEKYLLYDVEGHDSLRADDSLEWEVDLFLEGKQRPQSQEDISQENNSPENSSQNSQEDLPQIRIPQPDIDASQEHKSQEEYSLYEYHTEPTVQEDNSQLDSEEEEGVTSPFNSSPTDYTQEQESQTQSEEHPESFLSTEHFWNQYHGVNAEWQEITEGPSQEDKSDENNSQEEHSYPQSEDHFHSQSEEHLDQRPQQHDDISQDESPENSSSPQSEDRLGFQLQIGASQEDKSHEEYLYDTDGFHWDNAQMHKDYSHDYISSSEY